MRTPSPTAGTGANAKILIVEDEPQMADLIARGLRDEGYSVETVNDGANAAVLMQTSTYDLVLLDVQLPGKNGIAVCREARAQSVKAPILMVTALAGVSGTVNGLNCGADDYLCKPFDFGVLFDRIRALLRRTGDVRPNVLQVADLHLNTVDHSAVRGNRPLRLTLWYVTVFGVLLVAFSM